MSRIESGKVNLGSSYVISNSDEDIRSRELITAKRVAADIIANAQIQAKGIVDEAQKNAEQHMETAIGEAKAQVDEIHEKARAEGYQMGYDEGRAQIQQDLTELIENVDKFANSQFEIKKRIIKSAHNDIVNLVVLLADKVCHKQLELDNSVIYELVKSAILQLREKEAVTLIVNPNMAQKMYDISETLKEDILSLKSIKIIEDVNVSEDGAIVESVSSRVDSRISSQIDEVAQKLLVELQSVSEEVLVSEAESSLVDMVSDVPSDMQLNVSSDAPSDVISDAEDTQI